MLTHYVAIKKTKRKLRNWHETEKPGTTPGDKPDDDGSKERSAMSRYFALVSAQAGSQVREATMNACVR